jgi:hypothetical protein
MVSPTVKTAILARADGFWERKTFIAAFSS